MQRNDFYLDNCVKCSTCNTACPVMKVFPDYPGPKRLGPEWERVRLERIDCDTSWVEYCTGCGQCDLACPNQVKVSEIIARAKAEHFERGTHQFRDRVLARPAALGKLGSALPSLTNLALKPKLARSLLSQCLQTTPHRPFPAYRHSTLKPHYECANPQERVLFFPGCFVRYNANPVAEATINVLQANGFSVDVPDTACCGLPCLANGDREEALANARTNLAAMRDTVEHGGKIVTGCPSCGLTMKAWYPELFANDDSLRETAEKIAASTFDLGELLLSLKDAGTLNTRFNPVSARLAYHEPCHTKAQGMGMPWVELLRDVPGVRVADMDSNCCGMAGTYGFKNEKYAISMDIGEPLFKKLENFQPDYAISECGTCQMQIAHGAQVEVLHPVEILSQSYGKQPEPASPTR